MTYGELIDAMKEVSLCNIDAATLFGRWHNTIGGREWQKFGKAPAKRSNVLAFATDMVILLRGFIASTTNEEIYRQRIVNGHEFLCAIYAKCAELGFDVREDEIDVRLAADDSFGRRHENN